MSSVRGRALEGIGLALEGKGDLDGALKAFRELKNTDTRGLKGARHVPPGAHPLRKGETRQTEELLKGARERSKGRLRLQAGPRASRIRSNS